MSATEDRNARDLKEIEALEQQEARAILAADA